MINIQTIDFPTVEIDELVEQTAGTELPDDLIEIQTQAGDTFSARRDSFGASSSPLKTTQVNTTADLILAPYNAGDIRVLTKSDTNPAGSYRATTTEASTGNITHFEIINTNDFGTL